MRISECSLGNLLLTIFLKSFCSLTLRQSKNHSQRISTICLTVEKFLISSHQMRKLPFLMKLLKEQEMLTKVIAEIKFTLILFKFAEKIFILYLLSLLSEINSETGADSSQVSLTAAQSIGTTHGQQRLFTQLPIVNTLLMRLNLASLSTWTFSARLQSRSIPLCLQYLRTSTTN